MTIQISEGRRTSQVLVNWQTKLRRKKDSLVILSENSLQKKQVLHLKDLQQKIKKISQINKRAGETRE